MNLRVASFLVVGLAAGAVGLPACAAGSGELVTYASLGRDDPGAPRDSPPSPRDNPGSACIVCDVNYNCSGSVFAAQSGGQFQLSTSGGTCVKALIDLVCSGALFSASGCTGGGGGPFTCGNTTCSPSGTQGSTNVVMTVSGGGGGPSSSGGSTSSQGFPPDAG